MNIIKIIGGLGNQMLQYALYISMREKNIDCKMDISDLKNYLLNFKRDSIFNNFNVKNDFAALDKIYELGDVRKNIFSKIRRKIFGKKKSHYVQKQSREFIPEIFSFNNTYLDGYWFNVKYFIDYLNILKLDFTPKTPFDGKNLVLLNRILNTQNSIGIHVRLGDAINRINYSNFGGICTVEYYNYAISLLKNKLHNCHFFVFSNEPKKCRDMFSGNEFTFVENNDEHSGYVDLILMSKCHHNIIANSTFSFWSALLNDNDNIVVAPKKFSNINENRNDNCPNDWIRI